MKTYHRICSWDAVFFNRIRQYHVNICKVYLFVIDKIRAADLYGDLQWRTPSACEMKQYVMNVECH